ncbi:MAG TPA: CAP domain-containing protein [Edaphobacter sp.]
MRKLLLTVLMLTLPSLAQNDTTPDQTLLQLVNQHRTEANLPPLTVDPVLTQAARTHAQRMSQEKGEPQHQYPNEPDLPTRVAQAGAHYPMVSENIASGSIRLPDLDRAWMKSDSHRANILDSRATVIGIAVIDSHGSLYVVQDFAQTTPTLSREDVETKVRQLLADQGIKPAEVTGITQDARTACVSHGNSAPNATLVIHLEGPDFTELPDALVQQLPHGRQYTSAVGACPAKPHNQEPTVYRVAILLY